MSNQAVKQQNKETLESLGEHVGTLTDGRRVQRYKIIAPNLDNHWLYVIGNTTTMNYTTSNGDSTISHTEVVIDGVNYVPVDPVEAPVKVVK